MDKNSTKVLAVRLSVKLFEEFKEQCELNSKKMSDAVRDFIRGYIKESQMYASWQRAHEED